MPQTITASTQAPTINSYIRGDSRLLLIPVYEADGTTPFNLTSCTVYFTLNASNPAPDDGTDATAVIKKSVSTGFVTVYTSPTVNLPQASVPYIAQIQLLNADTQPLIDETYYYDIQLKDSSGSITSLGTNVWGVIDDTTTRVT